MIIVVIIIIVIIIIIIIIIIMIVISMCNQMVPKGSGNYQRLEKTRVRLFADFTRIPFDYPLTSWVTNYVSNREFLMCLSWIVSIENSTLSNA